MKGDVWPKSKSQEIFDDLKGARLFTTLDVFSWYWQILMCKCCKKNDICLPIRDIPVSGNAVWADECAVDVPAIDG